MRRLRSFVRDQSGSTAVTFALTLLPMVTGVGCAIDYSRAATVRTQLQASVDSAAIQAAMALAKAQDPELAVRATLPADQTEITAEVATSLERDRVTVVMRRGVATGFVGLLGINNVMVHAEATALKPVKGPPVCVLALSPDASGAVQFAGNTSFVARNCAVYSNSNSSSSITLQGSATATADAFCAVGGVSGTLTPTPQTGCPVRPDPLRNLGAPITAGCDYSSSQSTSVNPNNTKVFWPGIYCAKLDIRGTATFMPGTYVLKNGLDISSQATVSGDGVTFYFTGTDAAFSINGGGGVSLTAPASGSYAGILIFQDRNASPGAVNKLNGNSDTYLKGAIYTPTQTVAITGNGTFGQSSAFMPTIADRISFSGSSVVQSDLTKVATAVAMPTLSSDVRLAR